MWEFVKYVLMDIDDPVNVVPVILILACFVWSGIPRGQEKWTAWWALLNGLIHCWMDGFIGAFGRGPKWMVEGYAKIDARFWPTKDPTVMVMCYTELVLIGPLCIIWYNSIVKKMWYRHFLAIVISTLQIYGTDFYAFTEILSGLSNLPPGIWPLNFGSWDEIIYFWLVFIGASVAWTVIDLWLIVKSILVFRPKKEAEKND